MKRAAQGHTSCGKAGLIGAFTTLPNDRLHRPIGVRKQSGILPICSYIERGSDPVRRAHADPHNMVA